MPLVVAGVAAVRRSPMIHLNEASGLTSKNVTLVLAGDHRRQ